MELFSERVLLAALIANLAMIALPVGAALGIYAKPSQKLMSTGWPPGYTSPAASSSVD
jgi:hypothetical protein